MQLPACHKVTTRGQSAKRRGWDYFWAVFCKSKALHRFRYKTLIRDGLVHSGQRRVLPVISGREGRAPGQIRDNRAEKLRFAPRVG